MLSGDPRNSWFTNLTTLTVDKVGVEFAGTLITSTGFESVGLGTLSSSIDGSALMPQLGHAAVGAGLGLIGDVSYSDINQRGYLLMTVTAASVWGDYVFVSSVKPPTYSTRVDRTVTVAATPSGTAAPVLT